MLAYFSGYKHLNFEGFSKRKQEILRSAKVWILFANHSFKSKTFLIIQIKSYLISSDFNNEADWQKFEDDAEAIIKKCADTIRNLKEATFRERVASWQVREHLENVFMLLEKYLKDVCKFYSEQKAIRVKRVLEKKNLSQLCSSELLSSKKKPSSQFQRDHDLNENNSRTFSSIESQFSAEELQAVGFLCCKIFWNEIMFI